MVMKPLTKIFIQRLTDLGIDGNQLPGFVREMVSCRQRYPNINLYRMNQLLSYLGWQPFELDYHTFSLGMACLELEDLEHLADSGRLLAEQRLAS
jgi:hypothetical protein